MQISQTLITKWWSGNDCNYYSYFSGRSQTFPLLQKFPQ